MHESILDEFKKKYDMGKGVKNKAKRCNAERAVSEVRQGPILRMWDQRVICTVSKAKAIFGRMFKKEKEENDAARDAAETRNTSDTDDATSKQNELEEEEQLEEQYNRDRAHEAEISVDGALDIVLDDDE